MPIRLATAEDDLPDDDMPEGVEESEDEKAERIARFESFARVIASRRDEAVSGRRESGIEDVWTDCEEAYAGIDDANRGESESHAWRKPTTSAGGLERNRDPNDTRPTGFVTLTARYVQAGAAKAAEISIPVDGRAFSLRATPVQDFDQLSEDQTQVEVDGIPQTRPRTPEEMQQQAPGAPSGMAPGQPPGMPPGQPPPGMPPAPGMGPPGMDPGMGPGMPPPEEEVPLTIADLVKRAQDEAEQSADMASDIIHDWLTEGCHAIELRKAIFDDARLGVGIIKGPVPEARKSSAVNVDEDVATLEMREKIAPVTRWVDPWNFFPDPCCGENIHDGDYVIERDFLARGRLQKLKGSGIYIDEAIDRVLEEGPKSPEIPSPHQQQSKKPFEVWHYYGRISREDLELTNSKAAESLEEDVEDVFAIVTMVNDIPIRVALNPLESGSFPYHVACWTRRAGHWAGVGVAEQLRFPQRLINGATRALMTNAALSAGGIIALDDDLLIPPNGRWVLTPNMILRKAPDAAMEDVRKAIATFQIPNATQQLLAVIEYAQQLAEESTNIPLIKQGLSGKTTPDTFGGQQLQDNNANQMLRAVGYAIADGITTPLVKQMYEWMLLDPDVPKEAKGDHQVDASSSLAMVETAIQETTLMMLGNMVANPAFELSPARWMELFLKRKRLNPAELQLTDAEKEQAAQNQQPPPQIAAAQIRAESAERIAQSRDQLAAQRNQNDLDRDAAYQMALNNRDQSVAEARMAELQIKRELAMLEYATQERVTLEQVKAELAQTVMKLRTQKELAGMDGKGPEVTTPPTEPPQHAPDGRAYQE